MVTIDAETNSIDMDVSEEEIAARLKQWKAPRLKVNRGTLAKYVHLVGDASHGVRLQISALLYFHTEVVDLYTKADYESLYDLSCFCRPRHIH